MIGNVLSKSVREIQGYLDNPAFNYGKLRPRITGLLRDMADVQIQLELAESLTPNTRHITAGKYENDLKEAIIGGDPVHVYDVQQELSRLFDYGEYDSQYGHVGWIISDMRLSEEQLKDEIRTYLPDANRFCITREELIEKLPEMEEQTRSVLRPVLDGGGKLYLASANLKRRFNRDDTVVILGSKDFYLFVDHPEEIETSIGEVPAKTVPATR